jgi:hypothetical protein
MPVLTDRLETGPAVRSVEVGAWSETTGVYSAHRGSILKFGIFAVFFADNLFYFGHPS